MQFIPKQAEGVPFRCALRLLSVKIGKVRGYYTYYTTFDREIRLFPRVDGIRKSWYFGIAVRW